MRITLTKYDLTLLLDSLDSHIEEIGQPDIDSVPTLQQLHALKSRLSLLWYASLDASVREIMPSLPDHHLVTYVTVSQAMYRTELEQMGLAFEASKTGHNAYGTMCYNTALRMLGITSLLA